MVLGYHFIFSAYGFWLPNDPRGSWSDTIRVYDLLQFGPATKIDTTDSVAHVQHDRALRLKAKEALRYDPVRFTGIQARAIARGFGIAADEAAYAIYALAILPDHAHAVLGAHPHHQGDGSVPSARGWLTRGWRSSEFSCLVAFAFRMRSDAIDGRGTTGAHSSIPSTT